MVLLLCESDKLVRMVKLSFPFLCKVPCTKYHVQSTMYKVHAVQSTCSTQLRLKFILLINVKMPTIVGILTFMSRINY